MIRVAGDVAIGLEMQSALARRGVTVAVTARDREPDECWVARAARMRVHAVVSGDHGVGRLCADLGLVWVQLPHSYLLAREIVEWIEISTGLEAAYPPPPLEDYQRERVTHVVTEIARSRNFTMSQIARIADVDYDAAHDVVAELIAAGLAVEVRVLRPDGRVKGRRYGAAGHAATVSR